MKPKKPQWQIAQDLQIVEKEMRIEKTDSVRVAAGKKNVLTDLVGRYKKRVLIAVTQAAKGGFPF